MAKVNEKLGTDHQLFNYYGAPDRRKRVIVADGGHRDVAEEVIDYLTLPQGREGWPGTVAVVPRCRDHPRLPRGSLCWIAPRSQTGRAPYLDVVAALREAATPLPLWAAVTVWFPRIPPSACSPYTHEWLRTLPKARFTLGIVDDVTNLEPGRAAAPNTPLQKAPRSGKFWEWAATLLALTRTAPKIIGDHTTSRLTSSTTPRRRASPALRRQAHQQLLHQQG